MKLTFKLTTFVTLLLITLLSIFGYFIVQNEKKFIQKLQDKQSKTIVKTISTSIIDAVLLKDYPVIETVLEQTADAYENIYSITITQNNKILASFKKNTISPSSSILSLKAPVKLEQETIATVSITLNNSDNVEAIQERILDGVLLIIGITFITLISLVFLIKYLLIDKINYIKDETSSITIDTLQSRIEINTKDELHDLSENINDMTEKLYHEISQNKAKDLILAEQGKMAAMGEMIGNIAHQWRQPLSAISSSASSLKLFSQMGMLEHKTIEESCDDIVEKSKYLSDTIEIFRNFLKDTKEYTLVDLKKSFDIVFSIIGASLKNNNIKVEKNIPQYPIQSMMTSGEIEQVLINILNNAKDAILENKIENPKIIFKAEIKEEILIISIKDNAGGIPPDILPKIFMPYFTTKHQSKGTGLGLHMSYKIVVESLKGKIYAKNTSDGAEFFIKIPIIAPTETKQTPN